MANSNPYQARKARKKRRKIRKLGDLGDARRKLWQAITVAEQLLLDDQTDDQTALRAIHAITQATTAYVKLVEAGEFEARLEALEKQLSVRMESRNGRVFV